MRMSGLFSQTLRETPSEADVPNHQLLLRAGFIRQLVTGVFTEMPLGRRTSTRIEEIIRQEMDAIGGQEISMPVVQPADLWKETGRWYSIDSEMSRFKDRAGRDLVLAMTHEEVVADLVRKEVRSYRQLPLLVYHIQTKWRDDPRPRAGLIRVREFRMKDSYSLDVDWEGLEKQYRAHYQAYFNIFHRCGLPVIAVKSDTGMMGGELAHEFMYLTPYGEDTLVLCDKCGYAANRQIARIKKIVGATEEFMPVEKVATPGTKSIEELSNFLNVPKSRTAKAVFFMARIASNENELDRFIFAIVRGDMELNETKLANALHAKSLRPATEEEIRQTGAIPGFASPVGLSWGRSDNSPVIVVDDVIAVSPNLVAGANEEGFHLLNVNLGRDYVADITTDIAAAQEGDHCPTCSNPLRLARGVEVGNIFQLGTFYSEAMGCNFLDQNGQSRPVVMGSYGIGIGRLMACIAEEHHDDQGLRWPITVTPYSVHLIRLGKQAIQLGESDTNPSLVAEQLYAELQAAGFDVLYDDREESPGVKFNDADLIGIPIRLTVSERSIKQGGVEFKRRDRQEKSILPINQLISRLQQEISEMNAMIDCEVKEIAYPAEG